MREQVGKGMRWKRLYVQLHGFFRTLQTMLLLGTRTDRGANCSADRSTNRNTDCSTSTNSSRQLQTAGRRHR